LFDMKLRALRRDRAARLGPELFLLDRAFADCLERIESVQQRFQRALLIGCPDPGWRERLLGIVPKVDAADPGPWFANASGATPVVEDSWEPPIGAYDLVLAVGTLDSVNDLPRALLTVRAAMRPRGFFLGAVSGGETLPRLRAAMRAADQVSGIASPHVHPRIEASALAPLLANAGFAMPVVDVDRVQVAYSSLASLVVDLRRMGATNVLSSRARTPLSKAAAAAAAQRFSGAADGGRTAELVEILHFACWAPSTEHRGAEG
jgi:hypothetical protein